MRSLREGLCSETSSRSRQQPKENAQRPSCIIRAVFFYGGSLMDGLLTCAKAFEDLLPLKYHIIIGRKGKSVDLTVSFEAVEFHHLVGLHKLHDLRLSRASREKVFSQILSSVLARLLWRISKRAATSTASRTGWSLFKKLRYFSIKMTCSSVITESFRHFPLSKQSTYSLHLMNIPMCISFLTKKTRPGIFSVALFFQRRTGITQKVRLYIPFLKKKR